MNKYLWYEAYNELTMFCEFKIKIKGFLIICWIPRVRYRTRFDWFIKLYTFLPLVLFDKFSVWYSSILNTQFVYFDMDIKHSISVVRYWTHLMVLVKLFSACCTHNNGELSQVSCYHVTCYGLTRTQITLKVTISVTDTYWHKLVLIVTTRFCCLDSELLLYLKFKIMHSILKGWLFSDFGT